jgi:hypothetical protein
MNQLEQIVEAKKTNKTGFATVTEKIRLLLGMLMMFSGLYFGLFANLGGEGLGLLSVMISPFVMIADK